MVLAAALDKEKRQASLAVKTMLIAARMPHPCECFLAGPSGSDSAVDPGSLRPFPSEVAVGLGTMSAPEWKRSSFDCGDGRVSAAVGFAVDLRVWKKIVSVCGGKRPLEALGGVQGSYSAVAADSNTLAVYRDPVGREPLYFHEDSRWLLLASQKRSIWSMVEGEPLGVPPGRMLVWGSSGLKASPRDIRVPLKPRRISSEGSTRKLSRLLKRSVGDWCAGLAKAPVAFSGGIDSGLLAHLLTEEIEVELLVVGFAGEDKYTTQADEAASQLGLRAQRIFPGIDEAKDGLQEVVEACERSDPMSIEIALPLFFAAKEARELGHNVLFAGEAADEIFGGYMKYLKIASKDESGAFLDMRRDFLDLYMTGLERDSKACGYLGVGLLAPYTSVNLAEYALSLPVNLRVDAESGVRKLVLRRAADVLGVPPRICRAEKKAVQYSSGSKKLLRRLATESGQPIELLLSNVLERVKAEARGHGLPAL